MIFIQVVLKYIERAVPTLMLIQLQPICDKSNEEYSFT